MHYALSHSRCTHHSILTIHKVSTGVVMSGCHQAGELLLGSGDIVNLDTSVVAEASIPLSGHHHCVLQLDGTGPAANKDTE